MQLHELTQGNRKSKKRVGRGGKRGKTSGRGHKGQKARAGGTPRPQIRDIIKKFPKKRGHGKNRPKTVHGDRLKPVAVNVGALDAHFADGDTITPRKLLDAELVRRQRGRVPKIKILGQGTSSNAYTIKRCDVSDNARKKIEDAGGTIIV